MKKISLFLAVISLSFTINSCTKKDIVENVGIKINNQTDYSFDSFELNIYNGPNQETLDFENINANSTSSYKFIENLDYSQYDYSVKDVYFISEAFAYIGNNKYEYIGFCGTGLIAKSTTDQNFIVNILQIDLDNNYLFFNEEIAGL